MSGKFHLSSRDLSQIKSLDISENQVHDQLSVLKNGPSYLDLARPCTVGDGILILGEKEVDSYVNLYESSLKEIRPVRFVPASGAATRMFQALFCWKDFLNLANGQLSFIAAGMGDKDAAAMSTFLQNVKKFPFWPLLKKELEKSRPEGSNETRGQYYRRLVDATLGRPGLGYGLLPKGLVHFHRYGQNIRTAFEEHLVEAARFCRDGFGKCRLHFTAPEKNLPDFQKVYESVRMEFGRLFDSHYDVDFSVQSPGTNTIAMGSDGIPIRTEDGRLYFRPGGHGTLIKNLNEIDGDIVFINNVDNVAPDRLKGERARWKKAMAGLLISLQDRCFEYLRQLSRPFCEHSVIMEAAGFVSEFFGMSSRIQGRDVEELKDVLLEILDRPIRICGMVENKGDPGGAPFWVCGDDGTASPQIVESAQVDRTSPWRTRSFALRPISIQLTLSAE